jgi:hypothetical protein
MLSNLETMRKTVIILDELLSNDISFPKFFFGTKTLTKRTSNYSTAPIGRLAVVVVAKGKELLNSIKAGTKTTEWS